MQTPGPSSACNITDRNERLRRYSSLKDEIEDLSSRTTDMTLETATQANAIWNQINQIPLDGAETDELVLSGIVNRSVATFFIDKLPTLLISDEQITLDAFINNLKRRVDRDGWEKASEPFDFLRAGVSFQALNPRAVEPLDNASNKEKKQRQRKIDQVVSQATQPTQVNSNEGCEDHNAHVEVVVKTLGRVCKRLNGPVEFWPFVIDPSSFENTVENMFCVNILVNNDKVFLISDNGVNYLEPAKSTGSSNTSSCNTSSTKTQQILSVSIDQIERFIAVYDIKEAMIPRTS